MTARRLISIVIPVWNEEENVEDIHRSVCAALEKIADRYDAEIIFTDNHSEDSTFALLRGIAQKDPRVRVYRFSRNFGVQRSTLTGFLRSKGVAAIQLDADGQDPPELIPEFIRLWEAGHKVVYGVRSSRRESRVMRGIRKVFYRLIDALSEDELPHDAGDFRLIDRQVIEELRRMNDQQPYVRGAIAAMGFRQVGVPYDRPPRLRGSTKMSVGALFRLAFDGILNHSIVPLRIATFMGLAIAVITFLGVCGYAIGRFAFGQDWPPGFATTTILILGSTSLNAIFLGIIGEYLGRIYQQVKTRSLTIVEQEIGPQTEDVRVEVSTVPAHPRP